MKKEWFADGLDMQFENTTVKVPNNYKSVLAWEFGTDYMTPKRFTGEHEYPFYKCQEEAFIELLRDSGVEVPVDDFCRNWHKLKGCT